MGFRWTSPQADESVAATTGLDQEFATREEAEAWLGEYYEDLLDAGLDEVTLYDGETVVHEAMSLHP